MNFYFESILTPTHLHFVALRVAYILGNKIVPTCKLIRLTKQNRIDESELLGRGNGKQVLKLVPKV